MRRWQAILTRTQGFIKSLAAEARTTDHRRHHCTIRFHTPASADWRRYDAKIERLDRRLQRLDRLSRNFSRLRTALVLVGICCALAAERFLGGGFAWVTLGMFGAAFVAAAVWHRRVHRSGTRHAVWKRIKAVHVARLTHDWANVPQPPDMTPEPEHPFAADLNLFGPRSVHHLLDTSSSYGGCARLRTWLLTPLDTPEAVRERQQIVRELIPLVRFRDRLSLHGILLGGQLQARWSADKIVDWLLEESPPRLTPWVWSLGLLALANVVLAVLYALGHLPPWWAATLLAYLVLYTYKHREARNLFSDAYQLERVLRHLRAVLIYLENFSYGRTPHLAKLCEPYWRVASRPSASLRQIVRIAGAAGVQQGHLLGFLVNLLVPWDLFFADRLNRYKASAKVTLPVWIHTWYDLEGPERPGHAQLPAPRHHLPGNRVPRRRTGSAGPRLGAPAAAERGARAQRLQLRRAGRHRPDHRVQHVGQEHVSAHPGGEPVPGLRRRRGAR